MLLVGGAMAPLNADAVSIWPFNKLGKNRQESNDRSSSARVTPSKSTPSVIITGTTQNDPRVKEVLNIIQGMLTAANAHDIDAFMKFYANNFTSGDNLTREQLQGLIAETWERYPTIQYRTRLLEIRVNGNWITVDSEDYSSAKNIDPPQEIGEANPRAKSVYDPGKEGGRLATRARNLMYLNKVGDTWRVASDQALYEDAELRYGNIDGLAIEMSAPDKVFAGQSYTSAIRAQLPERTVAMTTINRSLMTYPHPDVQNAMRVLAASQPMRERVFVANEQNRNEMVSVTLGLLQGKPVQQGENKGVALELGGILTVVKRVNVVPKSTETLSTAEVRGQVNYSANGAVDYRKDATDSNDAEEDDDTLGLEE